MRLSLTGLSDHSVAAALGFPRATVSNWRHHKPRFRTRSTVGPKWRPQCGRSYSYLLGVYLGDGYICSTGPNSWRLGITLDLAYSQVIEEVVNAISSVDPLTNVCRNRYPGVQRLFASSLIWPVAFPQHGPGRKHERPIELADWQREITHEHPKALLRGLIHSDGSRCMNRFKTALLNGRIGEYAYPRYFFTNVSTDILGIFCEHCEHLGIRWTRSNWKNISVSHRDSVALMDTFIGPKR